jgi:hypothetical protein
MQLVGWSETEKIMQGFAFFTWPWENGQQDVHAELLEWLESICCTEEAAFFILFAILMTETSYTLLKI